MRASSPLLAERFGVASLAAAVLAAAVAVSSCAGAPAAWCDAAPVEFGMRRAAVLQLHVTNGAGDAAEARVRWRRHAILVTPGEWEESTTNREGRYASHSASPGRYEVEVCTLDGHALHGYVEVAAGAEDPEATLDTSRAEGR
jgi:hypothetical protein